MTDIDAPVGDDLDLLRLMMAELEDAPQEYRPTNYWANYEGRLVPHLEAHGLARFRRTDRSPGGRVLAAFGASDRLPTAPLRRLDRSRLLVNRATDRVPGWKTSVSRLADRLETGLVPTATREGLQRLMFEFAAAQAAGGTARPLSELSVSRAGDPEQAFEVDGHTYTPAMLHYYMLYAYVGRFVDLAGVGTIAELGSGVGKQAEVIAALHPSTTILLFDLPPQLYVANQYLTAVFGERVAGYRETRDLERLGDLEPGRIALLPTWRFADLRDLPVDLFWNCASFQEMEPDVVLNYLDTVEASATDVYIQAVMDGKERAAAPGRQGVLEPTTMAHYEKGLPSFELVDLSVDRRPDGTVKGAADRPYSNSIWRRRRP